MTVLILSSRPANERSRYKVTRPLIGWAQDKNQPCMSFIEAKNLSSGTSDAMSFVTTYNKYIEETRGLWAYRAPLLIWIIQYIKKLMPKEA